MTNYTPLNLKTHNSLLTGLSKPEQITDRLKELNIEAAGIADHNILSGNIDYYKALKKGGHKSLLGCQFNICSEPSTKQEKDNRQTSYLNLVARNKVGWKNLIRLITLSNRPDRFYHKPRLSLDDFGGYTDGLIAYAGSNMSILAKDKSNKDKLVGLFGKDNLFVEVQLFNKDTVQADEMRALAASEGLRPIATPNPYYLSREDVYDQRVLLCSSLGTTFPQVQTRLLESDEDGYSPFFKNDCYFLPAYDEMLAFGHTEAELQNTNLLRDMCESYDVTHKPILPEFKCPNGMNPDEYLRQLCREGWKPKVMSKIAKALESGYVERVKEELGVLQGAGLSSYFLILDDICRFIQRKGWLPNVGRGSAAGCLVSYLISLTQVDPIKYGLIFSRFYNEGRNTKDRVSMPDIDIDVPSSKRDEVLAYIKSVYGDNNVGQICAFQTMKGRGAIKAVLGAYGATPFELMNKITEPIPDEAEIADDLQVMKEEEDESSIIKWTLENRGKQLQEWVTLKEDGTIDGPLAKRFEQAIRLEGTRKSYGKHASGVVISTENLGDVCPLIIDKKNDMMITGLEMKNVEDIGLVKLDILGVNLLDKIQGIADILRSGDICE